MGEAWVSGRRLLLMGSSAYKGEALPEEVAEVLDEALDRGMTVIVGEARGACRAFQDHLAARGYRDVVVGHAKSIRYNAGGWPTHMYGDDVKSRERGMIDDCDSAIIVWVNGSGVIAKNLEYLKRLGKPTYVYELSTKDGESRFGPLDPGRSYSYDRRSVRPRGREGQEGLGEVVDAFLESGEGERLVESEDPGLTGYYLNKLIMERGLEGVLGVSVESGVCRLRRLKE
ncbi:hypothetical protein HQ586_07735 [Candidatus Bathyarchaeota archaeon]|nr:hypothetical protein [Candidatus Bathyarchaeota archaeon]